MIEEHCMRWLVSFALFCDDDGYELMKQNTYLPTYLPT